MQEIKRFIEVRICKEIRIISFDTMCEILRRIARTIRCIKISMLCKNSLILFFANLQNIKSPKIAAGENSKRMILCNLRKKFGEDFHVEGMETDHGVMVRDRRSFVKRVRTRLRIMGYGLRYRIAAAEGKTLEKT